MDKYGQAVMKGEMQGKKLDIIIEQLRIMRMSSDKDFEENAIGSALIILGSIYAIDNPLVVSSKERTDTK